MKQVLQLEQVKTPILTSTVELSGFSDGTEK